MNSTLQIIVNAIDNASSVLQGVAGGLSSVASNTQSLFSETSAASEQVVTALSIVGAAAVAAGAFIGKVAMDTQAAQTRLDTTTANAIANADAAAKGQGTLGTMFAFQTTQTNLAQDALQKLQASTKSNSDQVDAAQMKYDLAAAKLSVLKGRMDDAGTSADVLKEAFSKQVDAGVALGFQDDQVLNSLNLLEPMMGSKLAGSALIAAENMSRMSNGTLDLAGASRMLGMAMETGMGKGLAAYGIVVKDGVGGTEILKAAMEASRGQADAYAKTLSGSLAIAWSTLNEDMDKAGKQYLPQVASAVNYFTNTVLPATIAVMKTVAGFIQQHSTLFGILAAGIVAVVIPAFIAWAVAAGAAAIAVAVALWPFFVAGIATAAVVAGIFWLVDNWKSLWTSFSTWISDWVNKIVDFFKPLIDALNKIMSMISSVTSSASSIAGKTGGGIVGGLTSFGHILGFASGGIVNGPTLAMVGEAGPEAIIPLSAFAGGSSLAGGFGGGGNGNIVVNINGGSYLDRGGAQTIAAALAGMIQTQLKLKRVA